MRSGFGRGFGRSICSGWGVAASWYRPMIRSVPVSVLVPVPVSIVGHDGRMDVHDSPGREDARDEKAGDEEELFFHFKINQGWLVVGVSVSGAPSRRSMVMTWR